MIKPQKAVVDNTVYIAVVTVILSGVMQAVFAALDKWNITVLLGNLLGALAAVANFFIMAMAVQNAVSKEQKDAKAALKLSQTLRFLGLIIVAVIGYAAPIFDVIAVIIPYLFPQLAVFIYPIFNKNKEGESE